MCYIRQCYIVLRDTNKDDRVVVELCLCCVFSNALNVHINIKILFFSSDLDQTSKENGCDVMLIMHWALLFNILSHRIYENVFFVFLIVLTLISLYVIHG